ncbi:MAG: DUF1223 domain-containing protein [Thiotrichales bacterium]|nr:DUF1223 domain-containing protein [Thiotrichales bacterium]
MNQRQLTGAILFFLIFGSAAQSETVFTSNESQTGVIELYTSEGCSSCPPADQWLSNFTEHPDLWKKIIPLAFHVDYWDYIGWKDRFAMPEYTQRQRRYARQQSLRTIYTPGFIYNGREWRNWFIKRFFDFPEGGNPGILTLKANHSHARITFEPARQQDTMLGFNVALLGFGIRTEVQTGENSGRSLNHDFVVLGVQRGFMHTDGESLTAETPLPRSDIMARRYALVAWVNRGNDISPIQATGGYLSNQ